MKAWYVKSENITHEKQQELLDLAVDAGAVLDEHLSCTRHKGKGKYLQTGDHLFFGVTKDKMTAFEYQTFHFGPDAVEMTYDEAWMYVTGIIRAKQADDSPVPPMPQVAPELPEPASTLAKLREVHGNLNASVDEIVENYRQLKEIGHKVYELNQYCQENNIGEWGDSVIDSVIEHLEQSPTDRSKPRNKYDREIIPGVYVDVYDVLNAFTTGGPEVDHGVKKLLAPGERGDKDEITDLEEAIKSIQSRINHIKEWGNK